MKYFAIINDEQCGPFTLEELVNAGVRPDTYVWCKGMQEWEQADQVADICRYYRQYLTHSLPVAVPEQSAAVPEDSRDASERSVEDNPIGFRMANTPLPETDYNEMPKFTKWGLLLIALLCLPPCGIFAIYFNRKAKEYWKESESDGVDETYRAVRRIQSHKCTRNSKMMALYCICVFFVMVGVVLMKLQ